MEKENIKSITIDIPEGMCIDYERSTFDKIVFKKKELTYVDVCNKLFNDLNASFYYLDERGVICNCALIGSHDPNNLTSEKQAEKILALIKLMNTATYLNNGWKPDWNNDNEFKYHICYNYRLEDFFIQDNTYCQNNNIYFKTKELAKQAIEILGKDVIRTALSTDY